MGFFAHFNNRIAATVKKADHGESRVIDTPAKAMQEAHRRMENENSNRAAMGLKAMHPEEYKLRFNDHLASVYAEAKTNAYRHPSSQFAKAEATFVAPDGVTEAFKEAHRRTQAFAANLNATGSRSMTDNEYKIRFARHLSDVQAEIKSRTAAPRDAGEGKDEGQNPAFKSTAKPPRADGGGFSDTRNPATGKTASGPRDDGSTHRVGRMPPQQSKASVAKSDGIRTIIRKANGPTPIDLSNPIHVAFMRQVHGR